MMRIPNYGHVLVALSGGPGFRSAGVAGARIRRARFGGACGARHSRRRFRAGHGICRGFLARGRHSALYRAHCRTGAGAKDGCGLETAAREARYALLRKVKEQIGADVIATAHHRDDQMETVLMHLFRGCGTRLAGRHAREEREFGAATAGIQQGGLDRLFAGKRTAIPGGRNQPPERHAAQCVAQRRDPFDIARVSPGGARDCPTGPRGATGGRVFGRAGPTAFAAGIVRLFGGQKRAGSAGETRHGMRDSGFWRRAGGLRKAVGFVAGRLAG